MQNPVASPLVPFDPLAGLPNPESQPPAEIMTLPLLDVGWNRRGLLEALRLSRQLLDEVHLRDLEQTLACWQAVRQLSPAAAVARYLLLEEVNGGTAWAALRQLGQAALGDSPQRAQRLRNYGLMLRAVVYAYRFHGYLFGLFHKVTNNSQIRSFWPKKSVAVLDACQRSYGSLGIKTYFGPLFSDDMIAIAAQMKPCARLDPRDASLLCEIQNSTEQGVPVYIGNDAESWLITAVENNQAALRFYAPVPGTSHLVDFDGFVRLARTVHNLDVMIDDDFSHLDMIASCSPIRQK